MPGLRFLLDEHQDPDVAAGLNGRGIEATTVIQVGRRTLADESHIAWAAEHGYVIVTFDPDFLALAQAGMSHAGIAYCPARKYRIGALIERLAALDAGTDSQAMRGRVVFL